MLKNWSEKCRYSNNLQEIYPNITIVLRVILTIPVTVANAETSFSNLKIIKNVLHSTIANERLSALGIISLGYEVVRPLDLDILVDKFVQEKGRIKNFFK